VKEQRFNFTVLPILQQQLVQYVKERFYMQISILFFLVKENNITNAEINAI
jgi:hypothetical protein